MELQKATTQRDDVIKNFDLVVAKARASEKEVADCRARMALMSTIDGVKEHQTRARVEASYAEFREMAKEQIQVLQAEIVSKNDRVDAVDRQRRSYARYDQQPENAGENR